MVNHMKTTLDLSDELLIKAKKKAADLRRPLKALVEKGLRMVLNEHSRRLRKQPKIKWVTTGGTLPKELNLSSRERMHEWLKSES